MGPPRIRGRWSADGITIAVVDYQPRYAMPVHAHEELGISVVLRGQVTETAAHQTACANSGCAVVKPSGTTHADHFGPTGARLLAMSLRSESLCLREYRSELGRWRWTAAAASLITAVRAFTHCSEGEGADPPALAELACELIAALDRDDARDPRAAPRWLRTMRQRLDEEVVAPLRIGDLARDAGVHPVHAARAFRRHYGTPLLAYRAQKRLSFAMRTLADEPDMPLSQVAVGAGFADQSHLTRTIKRATGLTPRQYRDVAAAD